MIVLTTEQQEEANERQLAELEFVKSAYTPDEAWTKDAGHRSVTRSLRLPIALSENASCDSATIELNLEMPYAYPVHKDAHLNITASLQSCPANPPFIRKAALNALTPLVEACQSAVRDAAEEAVWHVFNRADEWIATDWVTILHRHELSVAKSADSAISNQTTVLGRRCIYSHHIIANSKRKSLASLASEYKLGGYVKIGWPGIILIEGAECSCQNYVDEIKSWRWQHLSIRVEEQRVIPSGDDIDSYRQLPKEFSELGEDEMSTLAGYCREAGLEHLFLQCLKISDGKQSVEEATSTIVPDLTYAALVHVDHMNDQKGYHKWLKNECLASNCTLFIKHCTSSKSSRPIIYVGIIGSKDGVKRVLKQWRISRVDVDSKNKPCLERMMTVLIECELPSISRDAVERIELISSHFRGDCSLDELTEHIRFIFGDEWAKCLATASR